VTGQIPKTTEKSFVSVSAR